MALWVPLALAAIGAGAGYSSARSRQKRVAEANQHLAEANKYSPWTGQHNQMMTAPGTTGDTLKGAVTGAMIGSMLPAAGAAGAAKGATATAGMKGATAAKAGTASTGFGSMGAGTAGTVGATGTAAATSPWMKMMYGSVPLGAGQMMSNDAQSQSIYAQMNSGQRASAF